MKITVKYFASLRELLGEEQIVELEQKSSIEDLKNKLSHEALAKNNIMVAVNQDVVNDNIILNDYDEVAFFPPVTGG